MARRASSASRVHVPGVASAVGSYLRAFAAHWDSRVTYAGLDALSRWELAVSGEVIWRALFDPSRPHAADQWMHDKSLWLISGPDMVESHADA